MLLRVIETISSWSGWFSGIGVVIMAVVITIDVFLRYFFGKPLLFADDISVYCMIFITFVGAALTLKMKRHIMVDMLYKMLPRRVQLWLDVVTTFVGCFVIWILTWYTIVWVRYTYDSGYTSSGILQTPMWIPMSVVPDRPLPVRPAVHRGVRQGGPGPARSRKQCKGGRRPCLNSTTAGLPFSCSWPSPS